MLTLSIKKRELLFERKISTYLKVILIRLLSHIELNEHYRIYQNCIKIYQKSLLKIHHII